ncbi:unnamed protein product [Gordionus sp. m RMFG-2023]
MLEFGLIGNIKKSEFYKESIKYLGYLISDKGILPIKEKIDPISTMTEPKNKDELHSWLGLSRFIRDFSKLAANLYDLLKRGNKFCWGINERTSFYEIREKLCNATILAHCDRNKELFISTDASNKGMGAVLFQVEEDGLERPI